MAVLNNTKFNQGFTLVELAIVIVIIGLLVGGVLQGQELVNQAKIRSQIKQLEGYNAAIAIFKSKYDFIPGDIPPTIAANFGLYSISCVTCTGTWFPNGNGQINDSNNRIPPLAAWSEPRVFYWQLKDAKLISSSTLSNNSPIYDVGIIFPEAAMGRGGIAAVSLADGNLYHFFGPTRKNDGTSTDSFLHLSELPSFTPEQAYGLDAKLDDSVPNTGNVRAVILTSSSATNFGNDTASTCVAASGASYNLTLSNYACRLIVKSL